MFLSFNDICSCPPTITYDLNGHEPSLSYQLLIAAIKNVGEVEWIQYSTWVVSTFKTEVQIRVELSKFIDSNDSLFVARFDAYASQGLNHQRVEFIDRAWTKLAQIATLFRKAN
jgi:hypothetical protein